MDEFDGVYQHRKTQIYFVVKVRDRSANRYTALKLDSFLKGSIYGDMYHLLQISENFIRTEGCKKLEVLHNIKERIYESNRVR